MNARCLAVLLVLWSALLARAQPEEPLPDDARSQAAQLAQARRINELTAASFQAFAKGDYAEAERVLMELTAIDGENFVVWYNLACARSVQDDGEQGVKHLFKAVELGFSDIDQAKRDPHLATVRTRPEFEQLVKDWDEVLHEQARANLRAAQARFGKGYLVEEDADLRLSYLSAFDPGSFARAREEITRLGRWGVATVFQDLAEGDSGKDAWVVVILPTRRDFLRWAVSKYGDAAVSDGRQIGGEYSHDEKRLIAQDLGGTLRHEFFHVLHWRSCTRLGQSHPVWIQEGICSLVEDYDVTPTGELIPAPSWRTNQARLLARTNKLAKIEELAQMPRDRFTGRNPLANYAQARTFFYYLHARGQLGAWYKEYTATYREDPTGVQATRNVLGEDLKKVNADFRDWVRELPIAAEVGKPGGAELGIDVEPADGEGLRIAESPRGELYRAGLRRGDVITGVNGRNTWDINELHRVLADYQPGDTVELTIRRRAEHLTVSVTLRAR